MSRGRPAPITLTFGEIQMNTNLEASADLRRAIRADVQESLSFIYGRETQVSPSAYRLIQRLADHISAAASKDQPDFVESTLVLLAARLHAEILEARAT